MIKDDKNLIVNEQADEPTVEKWLRAKNVLFYMRGENEPKVHEFSDIILSARREYVSWLDVRDVEERSGTVNEFNQLLQNGHLFVMNEKERLFAGYTGMNCVKSIIFLSLSFLMNHISFNFVLK
jgi:hypothetical protein